MNPIFLFFIYNGNTKHSTKDVKGGHTGNNFLVLDVHLNEKESSVKIQSLNILKGHHV